MNIKIKFNNSEEIEQIKKENELKGLYLIHIFDCKDEKFLVFSDNKPIENLSIEEKISILEAENADLREGLQAILRGDMQSLAYVLYPEDFINIEG